MKSLILPLIATAALSLPLFANESIDPEGTIDNPDALAKKKGAYTMKATLDGEDLSAVRASFHDMNSVKILQTPLLKEGKHTLILENTGESPVYMNSFAYESVNNLHR